jgi:hypothetical protein
MQIIPVEKLFFGFRSKDGSIHQQRVYFLCLNDEGYVTAGTVMSDGSVVENVTELKSFCNIKHT